MHFIGLFKILSIVGLALVRLAARSYAAPSRSGVPDINKKPDRDGSAFENQGPTSAAILSKKSLKHNHCTAFKTL